MSIDHKPVQIPVEELPEMITEWFDDECTQIDAECLVKTCIPYIAQWRRIRSSGRFTQWKFIAKQWSAPEIQIRLLDRCLVSTGPEYAQAIVHCIGLSDEALALIRRQDGDVEKDLCMAVYSAPF